MPGGAGPAGNAGCSPGQERREWLCSALVQLELLGFRTRSDQSAPPECSVAKVPKGSGVSAVVGSESKISTAPGVKGVFWGK